VLQLFRSNNIIAGILGFAFIFIWHSSVYFNIPEWEPSRGGILMQVVDAQIGYHGTGARITVFILLAIQFFLANHIINSFRLADAATVFPGVFLILFSCYLPQFLFLSSFHFVNTLSILIFYLLFGTYNQPKSADHLFNAGLLAGISYLFFPPSLFLIPIIFIALSILRPYQIKERIMVLIGFVIPLCWAGLYYFWQDQWPIFYQKQFTHLFGIPRLGTQALEYVSILLYLIFISILLFLIFSYDKIAYRRAIQSRKRINIMYWSSGIIFAFIFFIPGQGNALYLLLSMPLGLLTALGFIGMNPKLAEIFHFILILGLLVSHYLGLFL
jgi:hypothetical protein